MYREPKAAKRLYFDVIPRHVDEYQQFLDGYERQDGKQRLGNPVWHIHSGNPPKADMPISFSMLLTLVSSSNAENAETLWGFIGRYRPGVTPQTHPEAQRRGRLRDPLFPRLRAAEKEIPRAERGRAQGAARPARRAVATCRPTRRAEQIQDVVYEIGRRPPFLDEKKKAKDGKPGVSLDWFNMLYQVLLGQEKGPRFGSFVAVYGAEEHRRHDRRRAGAVGIALAYAHRALLDATCRCACSAEATLASIAALMTAASLRLIGCTIVSPRSSPACSAWPAAWSCSACCWSISTSRPAWCCSRSSSSPPTAGARCSGGASCCGAIFFWYVAGAVLASR